MTEQDVHQDPPAPPGVDVTIPHSARIYDYWLGGKDNFAADRAMGDAFVQAIPSMKAMAQENRSFMHRVVRHLTAEVGVRQFLDIGTGIPAAGNVHQVAQEIAPDARVVYADNDPVVLSHARALMAGSGGTAYIEADLRDPRTVLESDLLRRTLDLDRPVGLLLIAILMLLPESDDPVACVRALTDALPSGSHLAITHPTADFNPGEVGTAVAAAARGGLTLVPRTQAEVERFFGDWELLDPGVVPVKAWRPAVTPVTEPESAYYWAGVARKA